MTNTLVKYDNPVLVTQNELSKVPHEDGDGADAPCTSLKRPAPPPSDTKKETEEILNTILPPREWEEEGQIWRQHVSKTLQFFILVYYVKSS